MAALIKLWKCMDWLIMLVFVMAWNGYLMMLLGILGGIWSLVSLIWTHHPITTVVFSFLFVNCIAIGLLQRICNYALDLREELKRLNKPESLTAIGGWMTL
jgi:hypothetical protein